MNGSWSSWICDKNTGEKKRVRQCNHPVPLNGGISCLGSHVDVDICAGKEDLCSYNNSLISFNA